MAVMPAAVLKKVVYNSLGNVVCESRDRPATEVNSENGLISTLQCTPVDLSGVHVGMPIVYVGKLAKQFPGEHYVAAYNLTLCSGL